MTITQVQVRNYEENDASVTNTWSSTPTAGNLLVAICRGTAVIAKASISGWTLANSADLTFNYTLAVFYKYAGASEGNVTLDWTDSTKTTLIMAEYSNSAGWNPAPLDKTAKTDATTSNITSQTTGTTATTTVASELCFAAFGMGSNVTSLTYSNSYADIGAARAYLYCGVLEVSSTGAQECTASWTTALRAGGVIATFKAPSGIAIPIFMNQYRQRG